MENEVFLCGTPTCEKMAFKICLFPIQFYENRWKIGYLGLEIDYNIQISTWKLFFKFNCLASSVRIWIIRRNNQLGSFLEVKWGLSSYSVVLKKRRGNNRLGHGQSTLRLFLTSNREPYFPCLQNLGLKMVGWETTMTHKHMNFCTEVNPALLLCS